MYLTFWRTFVTINILLQQLLAYGLLTLPLTTCVGKSPEPEQVFGPGSDDDSEETARVPMKEGKFGHHYCQYYNENKKTQI